MKTNIQTTPIQVNYSEHPSIKTAKFYFNKLISKDIKYFTDDELLMRLSTLKLINVDLCVLSGDNLYDSQEQLNLILPQINFLMPVRINLNEYNNDALSLVFIKNIMRLVSGFCLDIKIPLYSEYTNEQKERFSTLLNGKDVYTYRNDILRIISIISNMDLTIFRTCFNSIELNNDDKDYIINFSKSLKPDWFFN